MLSGDGLPEGGTDLVTLFILLALVPIVSSLETTYALAGLEVNLLSRTRLAVVPIVLLTLKTRGRRAAAAGLQLGMRYTYNLTHVGG